MVRTIGAASQREGWKRPTASAHWGDRGASSNAPPVGGDVPSVGGDAPHIGGGDAGEVVGFSRGPSNVSLFMWRWVEIVGGSGKIML